MEKPSKLIIEQDNTLVRDVKTNAVLNTDKTALEQYRAKRNKEREMLSAVDEVKSMKKDISELKELLHQLIAEKNK